jgi:hypothetical protein
VTDRTSGVKLRGALTAVGCVALSAALAACTTTSVPTPTPPSTSPTPTVVNITALPPEKPSQATVVVDDPSTVRAVPDSDPYGPSTFYVQGDTITMDDWVNDKIAIYRNGKRIKTLATTDNCCADLIINEDHYWILGIDDDNQYKVFDYVLEPAAKRLTLVAKYPAAGNPPRWITREGQNIVLKETGRALHLIAGPGPLAAAPKLTTINRGFEISDSQTTIKIATRDAPLGITLVTRTDSHDYYWVTDNGTGPNYGWIYQLTKAGELVHTYTLVPPGDRAPNRPFQIAPDGQLYEMVISDKTTRIYRIAPNP